MSLREQLQKYYADKKIFWRIVIVIIFVLIIAFQFVWWKKWSYLSLNSEKSFAGEAMPNKWRYVLNIERFDREVALVKLNPAQFIMIYKRWNLIIPTIEKELEKAGLPDDLKYIPVIESALRDNVSSSAGAAGLRQFMPDTARSHGLIVNELVDERFDVAKSTAAAISYFQDLNKQFSQRTLAAAAYNRGENGLKNSLESQITTNFYDLWINNETSRYVFRLLAMKYVREHKYEFFDRKMLWAMYSPLATKTISVKNIDDLADRARKNKVGYYEVKKLNPWIMKNNLPDGKWDVQIMN